MLAFDDEDIACILVALETECMEAYCHQREADGARCESIALRLFQAASPLTAAINFHTWRAHVVELIVAHDMEKIGQMIQGDEQ